MKTQLSEEEMIKIIEDFKRSGLTRKQFCKNNSYPLSNFYYWQKKYHEKYPLPLEVMKARRGRKSKELIEAIEAHEKHGTGTTSAFEDQKAPGPLFQPKPTTKRKRGRPRKSEPVIGKETEPVTETKITGPVIQIRYPNGTRVNLSADIDMETLKELIKL